MTFFGLGGTFALFSVNTPDYGVTLCTTVNITKITQRETDFRFKNFYQYEVSYKIGENQHKEITRDEIDEKFEIGSKFGCYYEIMNEKIIRITKGTSKNFFLMVSAFMTFSGISSSFFLLVFVVLMIVSGILLVKGFKSNQHSN